MTDDDRVFKALADPTRRLLLDRLFVRDGRTLTELESEVAMTRFGVMKHLRVLEDAGLVVAQRAGREKLHFLNPVPIRLLHDRWIDKYTERQVSALVSLKTELEETAMGAPELAVDGEVIESDPPRKLVLTWRMVMDAAAAPEGFTRLTYDIAPGGPGVTMLTVTHELEGAPKLSLMVSGAQEEHGAGGGWSWILSGLKTLLETGNALDKH
ncbi:hypothetical protein BH11GEM1_BH11GEM1_33200 [soil metagenome]